MPQDSDKWSLQVTSNLFKAGSTRICSTRTGSTRIGPQSSPYIDCMQRAHMRSGRDGPPRGRHPGRDCGARLPATLLGARSRPSSARPPHPSRAGRRRVQAPTSESAGTGGRVSLRLSSRRSDSRDRYLPRSESIRVKTAPTDTCQDPSQSESRQPESIRVQTAATDTCCPAPNPSQDSPDRYLPSESRPPRQVPAVPPPSESRPPRQVAA